MFIAVALNNRNLQPAINNMTSSKKRPTIGLCMIVKNESHIIERSLESVKTFIDFVLIEDTGSTDGTQTIIREWLSKNRIDGKVYDRPWVNFADNRSNVLAELRNVGAVDYALMIDADDEFIITDELVFQESIKQLSASAYQLQMKTGNVDFFRVQLVSNRENYFYRGVIHEYLEGPKDRTAALLKGCVVKANTEGARSLDPLKYHKDAEVLRQILKTEEDPFLISRYTFYLAQSCRDSGQNGEAIANYLKRVGLGYWAEEEYCSLLYAGRLMDASQTYSSEVVIETFERAIAKNLNRQEAYFSLAWHLRSKNQFAEAVKVAERGLDVPKPSAGLFVEGYVYDYGLRDELSVSAYWKGDYQRSLSECLLLLKMPVLPNGDRERIQQNAVFAADKLEALLNDFRGVRS